MELTKDQITALKGMKQHPWYKVLELLQEDITNRLWKTLLSVDLKDEKTIKILEENQIYVQAMRTFLKETDKFVQEVYSPDL